MSWLRRRPRQVDVRFADDSSMVVLITARDAAEADSAVLAHAASCGVDLTQPLLLVQHLVLPDAAAVEVARTLLAQDGYELTVQRDPGAAYAVRAWRTQVITAMAASQERSRAAGLAQRLGGDVRGWEALGPRQQLNLP